MAAEDKKPNTEGGKNSGAAGGNNLSKSEQAAANVAIKRERELAENKTRYEKAKSELDAVRKGCGTKREKVSKAKRKMLDAEIAMQKGQREKVTRREQQKLIDAYNIAKQDYEEQAGQLEELTNKEERLSKEVDSLTGKDYSKIKTTQDKYDENQRAARARERKKYGTKTGTGAYDSYLGIGAIESFFSNIGISEEYYQDGYDYSDLLD